LRSDRMTGNGAEEGRQEGIRWMTGFEIDQDDQIGDRVEGRLEEWQTGNGGWVEVRQEGMS
jgi:hypothetical protein